MRVYGEKTRRFNSAVNYFQVDSVFVNKGFYKIVGSNRHIALIATRGDLVHNKRELVISEYRKEPLWKQDMHMRMGRPPKHIEQRRILRIKEIDKEEAKKYKFEVYEVRI